MSNKSLFDEEIVVIQNSITQEGVVVIEGGKNYSEQRHAKLEVYLG